MAKWTIDRYQRRWLLPLKELCKVCGQPDSVGDCDHRKLRSSEVETLGGRLPNFEPKPGKKGKR